MKAKNKPQMATTTAEQSNITRRPIMNVSDFQESLCIMAQIQKDDELLGADDEETKEIFTSLYNNQVKEIKSGKTNKLLEFIGVLRGENIDIEKLYTATQTLRLLKFKDSSIDDNRCLTFKSNLLINFKTLDVLQFILRKAGVNKV